MNYLLGFFLIFVAFGIALKINAWMLENRRSRAHYHSAVKVNKKESVPQPVAKLLLFIAIAIIYVIAFSSDNTYYNYHLLTLLFMSLASVLLMVLGIVIFTPEGRRLLSIFGWANWFDRFFRAFLVICCLLVATLSLFGFPSLVIENVNGLIKGPAFSTGIVEGKSTGGGTRTGPLLYFTINEEKYKVPDYRWWESVKRGEEVRFAYNLHTIDRHVAFRPEKVSLSTWGILVGSVGIALWFVTIGIASQGYGALFIGKQNDFDLPIYDDFYARPENSLAVGTETKPKRRSITWVIVGSLLTILLVAWRNFRRATKK